MPECDSEICFPAQGGGGWRFHDLRLLLLSDLRPRCPRYDQLRDWTAPQPSTPPNSEATKTGFRTTTVL